MAMNDKYVSSIVTKYGDIEKVKHDVKTLNEILDRQGSIILIDVISEHAGTTANKFKLNEADRMNILNNLINDLRESLQERL